MLFRNILFSLIVVTGFFAASEFILASIGVTPVLLTEDPFVGFADNVPQFVETSAADGSVMLQTANNRRGLFNYQSFPKQKGEDSYRIFCMGGSTTYGRPYADPVSFCGWLRAYLKAADTTRHWEVINAGGISFASYRVARLMNELAGYQPDLFIVYTGQNEFLEDRSYGQLARLPGWLLDLNVTLSGTRVYTVMKDLIESVRPAAAGQVQMRTSMDSEVDEILNNTIGPESYFRDDELQQQVVNHYRLNLVRMARIARDAGAAILFVQPAANLKDMSPFKSAHRDGLQAAAQQQWEASYRRATGLAAAGKYEQALDSYRQALAIDDRYADLHFDMGKAWFALRRYEQAEQAFTRAIEEDIAPLRILPSMQRVVEDVAASEQVPLVDFPQILRAAYRAEYGHAVFGREFFQDHVHTSMEGYRLLGLALLDELVSQGIATPGDDWDAARADDVRQAVIARIDPRAEGETMLNLGRVFDWAGKFEEARNALLRALEILGPDPVIYNRLARSVYGLGRHEEAIDWLNRTLDMAPDFPDVHSRLARIYGEMGRTADAIRHCRAELALDPEDFSVHGGLAKLLERTGDEVAAARHYQSALQINPDYQYAHVELGYLLVRQSRYDEALPHAEAALRINPGQHRVHNLLGLVRQHQGQTGLARQHFTDALRLQPDYTIARENLQQLQAADSTVARVE